MPKIHGRNPADLPAALDHLRETYDESELVVESATNSWSVTWSAQAWFRRTAGMTLAQQFVAAREDSGGEWVF